MYFFSFHSRSIRQLVSIVAQTSGVMSQITATLSANSEAFQRFMDIGFCVLFGIIILGCITTPLIPVFLCTVNIGSKFNQGHYSLKID